MKKNLPDCLRGLCARPYICASNQQKSRTRLNVKNMALKSTIGGLDIPNWIPTAMRVTPLDSRRRYDFPFNGDYVDCIVKDEAITWYPSLKGASTDRDYVDAGLVWSETQRCWGVEEK